MKIISFLLLIILLSGFVASAQKTENVLLSIGNEQITKEEFLAVYKKNNVDGDIMDKKSIEEYLDLYIKFKLKVKEAQTLGMDTLSSFRNELNGYREQLAQPYLIDEETNKALIEEAYTRRKEDLRASHILIRLDKNALPKDTLAAYNKIGKIREEILQGKDFSAMAEQHSEDPSARDRNVQGRIMPGNKGDLGYFTVFDMVYPFETAAYNTPLNEISLPVRTDFGYHILKITDRQPAMGKVQCAHILLKYNGEVTTEQREELKEKATAIYQEIRNGKGFEEAAGEYSEDPGSAAKGGVLPWFGSNRMIPDFIKVVTKMKSPGEISEPFETSFGWHIVKLIDTKPVRTFEEEKDDIKNRLARSDRSDKSKETLIKKILKDYGFTEFQKEKNDAFATIDSNVFQGTLKIDNLKRYQKTIFTIGNKKIYQHEFLNYILDHQKKTQPIALESFIEEQYNAFVGEKAIAYEDSNLENKYPEFRLLMQEYRDGILLFDLMDKKIWSYAIRDTTGLKNFYEKHKANYIWKERAHATLYTFTNEAPVKKARKLAKNGVSVDKILNEINAGSALILTTETGDFEQGSNEIIDATGWEKGVSKTINHKGKYVFVTIHEFIPPTQKKLSECRGLVISDYQNYLEEVWVKELMEKYPVTIHQEVLDAIK
ncbi:MAG TPA: peptidylprolyl isomerase [Bacteroidales bacterium]|nr:peptidylprolyl isomerase [Bacteroidales bacterium]